ncbi:antibiotic transporter permease [Lactobacillus sp. ESL0681]|uniref:antibiotic transporter permease n=1 Tax=Lactobacillus sp. ESL0681 TaxID=2983211 RepID=UPI0023F9670A|nr:antibiotic transporter permease [Lactobacillus sp. ESL0681]WEV40508.1 antibiotic transporter permease [Lactobacillus sp. ESL0681]
MLTTQFSSLSFLHNWRTKLVYFFITPIIDLFLLVLINAQYTDKLDWSVAVASIAIDAASLAMQTMGQLLIKDADLQIDYELIAKRPFSWRYWTIKTLVALVIGMSLALINLGLLFCFGAPIVLIKRAVILLPLLCLYGAVLGFGAWAGSWRMNDPYFLINIFSSIMQLVAGVLVIISAYPTWLNKIALLFPFYEPINFIKFNHANLTTSIFVTLTWLIIGIIAYTSQIKFVLQTRSHHY